MTRKLKTCYEYNPQILIAEDGDVRDCIWQHVCVVRFAQSTLLRFSPTISLDLSQGSLEYPPISSEEEENHLNKSTQHKKKKNNLNKFFLKQFGLAFLTRVTGKQKSFPRTFRKCSLNAVFFGGYFLDLVGFSWPLESNGDRCAGTEH